MLWVKDAVHLTTLHRDRGASLWGADVCMCVCILASQHIFITIIYTFYKNIKFILILVNTSLTLTTMDPLLWCNCKWISNLTQNILICEREKRLLQQIIVNSRQLPMTSAQAKLYPRHFTCLQFQSCKNTPQNEAILRPLQNKTLDLHY